MTSLCDIVTQTSNALHMGSSLRASRRRLRRRNGADCYGFSTT